MIPEYVFDEGSPKRWYGFVWLMKSSGYRKKKCLFSYGMIKKENGGNQIAAGNTDDRIFPKDFTILVLAVMLAG